MSTGAPDRLRLVADVGGTHARFALVAAGSSEMTHDTELATADYPDLAAAVQAYLAKVGADRPSEASIAIANPVQGDAVKMTNGRWAFSIEKTRVALGLDRLLVINDFEALARAVLELPDKVKLQIGPAIAPVRATLALVGPGTGLGVSALVPGDTNTVLPGEGGHATLAACDAREADVIAQLRRKFSRVSAERALSGPGLVNLYDAICVLNGTPAETLEAEAVSKRGSAGTDAACAEALAMFCAMLGGFAGDLALIYGARGGVYIGGGIAAKIGDFLQQSAFRTRFEEKGRMSDYTKAIPTFLINAPHAALVGALAALS